MEVSGRHAFGYLSAERGVHRLVRLSPYDPNHLRHTSFAEVEILPSAEEDPDIDVRQEDIKLDVFRSSGPGGQNVQKVASAVRLTHLPTGMVVSCQNERSQHQNREFAMRILKAKLLAKKNEEKAIELAKLRGDRSVPGMGEPNPQLRFAPVQVGEGPPHQLPEQQPRCGAGRQPGWVYRGLSDV